MNKELKIITVSGFAGSGKSEFAHLLTTIIANSGLRVKEFTFAKRPKEMFAELMGVEYSELFSTNYKKNLNRKKLVDFAEKYCKELFGKDVWARSVQRQIMLEMNNLDVIVISDLRFRVEFEMLIKSFPAVYLTRMNRRDVEPKTDEKWYEMGMTAGVLTPFQVYQYYNISQPNEIAWESDLKFVEIDNNHSIERLEQSVREYLNQIKLIKTKEHV